MIHTDKQIDQDWGWKCLKLQEEVSDLRAQVEALHADGAVMRGALEYVRSVVNSPNDARYKPHIVEKALSTNAGRDLLARYREAVELLRDFPKIYWPEGSGPWIKRRDTLLATVKGGV